MGREEDASLETQLLEVWELVDELGDLSLRLRLAAEAAMEALELPEEEK